MMTRRIPTACAGLAALLLWSLPQGLAAQEPYPGFDAYVAKSLQTLRVPGVAIAIVRNDSVIYHKGFGVLAAGSRTPVTDETLFEIGSSSKAFTATLVSMLVSDGKVRYDDLISKYLPDFKLYDPAASAQVTIRDGLAHRSGIGRGELVWLDAGGTRDDVLHRVRFLRPESPFRSKWSYQNILYLAAGEAAGKAAGTSWDDLVQRRIFTPLGMTSSSPTYRGVTTTNIATAHAMNRDSIEKKAQFDAENIAPAGGIVSNAKDMAQWLRFQLNDGVVDGKRLVSSAALRETHTPQMLIGGPGLATGDQVSFSTYGMGWIVQDYKHELAWQHGGNTPGMTAAMGLLPEKKLGVVVLANMDHTPLTDMLMRYVFDRHLGAPMRDYVAEASARLAAAQRRPDTAAARVAAAPPLPLTAYVGAYADSLYGEATVTLQNGRLEFTRGSAHGPLEYWSTNNFRWHSTAAIPATSLYIKFDVTPDDRVTGVYYGLAPDVALLGRKPTGTTRASRPTGQD